MRIGVPTEIKNNENRVAITAGGVVELTRHGHEVLVQRGAGLGSMITDDDYLAAGAKLVESAAEVWASADMVLKVKEPIPAEYGYLRKGLTLFTYFHLAASRELTKAVLDSGVTAIAYETVEGHDGSLPLLAPMSEIAGRLSVQVGAYSLMKPYGGRGILLGGVTATRRGKVVVIGGGVAGEQATRIALGMGAEVTVLDISLPKLKHLEDLFDGRIQTRTSNSHNIAEAVSEADLVIGSVLLPGKRAPKLVTEELVSQMKPGSVLVDIAIDQGGCFENSRPTTHDAPTFQVHNSVFYCVANMPGAVPETSTVALTNATLPYAEELANHGWKQALLADSGLALGLNAHAGVLYNQGVSQAFPDFPVAPISQALI